MSNELVITTELVDDYWLVTAELSPETTLPKDIFLYENTGTNVLGPFFGTCSVVDLTKFRVFQGDVVPIFGNRYLRYHQAKIKIALDSEINLVIQRLLKNVKDFNSAYLSMSSNTKVYPLV